MAKKSLAPLTETMFYVLMAFCGSDMCGTEIAGYIRKLTNGRVYMGPGTLYTILSVFQKEKIIEKVAQEGRKITYSITEKGQQLYNDEVKRLRACLSDAERTIPIED